MVCKTLCGNTECLECFHKSFACNEKSKFLHDKTIDTLLLYKSSHKKYEFDCNVCKHTFSIALNNVICGKWCAFCANKQLCDSDSCEICFLKSFASHDNVKYWSNKNDFNPRQIFRSCNKLCLFVCDVCNHEFQYEVLNFVNNKGCPYCAIPSQRVCNNHECKVCYNRSFASETKAQFWSNRNTIHPRAVLKYSDKKYWFDCVDCNHKFESSLNHVTNGTWCPFCAVCSNRLCDNHDCIHCFNKSFASDAKSKYWSEKNKTKPRDHTKHSTTKHIFNCHSCKHEFTKSLAGIGHGQWCPYCSIPTNALCDDENCQHCYQRSFASHINAEYWSSKNTLKPRFYTKCSKTKCWFICKYCENEYQASLDSMRNNTTKCNICTNRSELKVFDWLKSLQFHAEMHRSYEWCVWKRKCYYNFVIEEMKIIIELDGEQHFTQVGTWKSHEETQDRDIYKMQQALEHGYSIIRIYQVDVYQDLNDWQNKLYKAINNTYKSPQVVYIASTNCYNVYVDKMAKTI